MGGTLFVREDASWLVQSWIHDNVLGEIRNELDPSLTELREMLYLADMERARIGDLRSFSESEMRAFLQAAEQVYTNYLDRGPQSFYQPEFYPSLMISFSELVAVIRVDPRVETTLPSGKVIYGGQTLSVPGVFYDFMLECCACLVRLKDEAFSQFLTASRIISSGGTLNIDELEPNYLALVQDCANWLVAGYGDGLGRISTDKEFLRELATYVNKFHDLVVGGRPSGENSS